MFCWSQSPNNRTRGRKKGGGGNAVDRWEGKWGSSGGEKEPPTVKKKRKVDGDLSQRRGISPKGRVQRVPGREGQPKRRSLKKKSGGNNFSSPSRQKEGQSESCQLNPGGCKKGGKEATKRGAMKSKKGNKEPRFPEKACRPPL